MKKIMMMIAMLAMTAAMQAQTKFHDVEANEAKGAVKSISMSMMGMTRTTNFDENGKMTSGDISDAVYNEEGYVQSAKLNIQGQATAIKYGWDNGRVVSQTIDMMGREIKTTYKYDENGIITSQSIDMGGQMMESPFTDYKFDDHGNWISRKTSMMGQEMELTRTITYYE